MAPLWDSCECGGLFVLDMLPRWFAAMVFGRRFWWFGFEFFRRWMWEGAGFEVSPTMNWFNSRG